MSNTFYMASGNTIRLTTSDNLSVTTTCPVGNYCVKFNQQTSQFYLEKTELFTLPQKIYGKDQKDKADRILQSFLEREKSTGVLLEGEKGSGKTMLAKLLSMKLNEMGYSTIIINEGFCGTEFNQFIGSFDQPAMVFFDEFEKIYDKDDQEKLLTLLDGVVETKKLYAFTSNSEDIDNHMLNRPGRVFYHFVFGGLDDEFVEEYIDDVLKNKEYSGKLKQFVKTYSPFTFDMLSALVEEMNRFNLSPEKAIDGLNIDISANEAMMKLEYFYDGQQYDIGCYPKQISMSELMSGDETIEICTREVTELEKDFDHYAGYIRIGKYGKDHNFDLSHENISSISDKGVVKYVFDLGGKELVVRCSKQKVRKFNPFAF